MFSYRTLTVRLALAVGLALTGLGVAPAPAATAAGNPDLGPNVMVFDPTMPTSDIQAAVDSIYAQQVNNEMGSLRYALLFKPGSYGTTANPLIVRVGYYTEVAGLGRDPGDVTINGHVDVYNRCLGDNGTGNCLALDNFWRSLSNLTINVMGLTDCRSSGNFWAASQASPMRRVNIQGGNLTLMDYCTAGPQFASGGFIADSKLPFTINGSQQQYLVRDSSVGGWSNAVWNQVFAGVAGAPDGATFPNPPYTTLPSDPASRERPYLYVGDDGSWNVFVPDPRTDSSGATWADGHTPGHSIPLSDFYVARPGESARSLDSQLARGMNLLLTPGVYDVASSLNVRRSDTVVLGLGLATLTATNGAVPIRVGDVKGVNLAGLTIDAGPTNSPLLMQVGTGRPGVTSASAADPTTLSDVFFRIGGPHAGSATVSLEVNSNHVILDDIWAWRADHGNPGSVGWDINRARNGVIVNGDDVTATGLFVEHYQQYNVIWNGEGGRTVFFQNELPYDAPDQAAWSHDGEPGWAAYKVADDVTTNELWGGGSYIFTNVDPTLHAAHGFEVPVTPGVRLHHLLTVSLNNAGTIDHVVNDTGAPVEPGPNGSTTSYVVSYP
jgi:hypothetical protein